MSKRVPYFNFYPADFMLGVRGMTPQEVGIYTMILCMIYEHNGPVAMNSARLSAYCGCRVTTLEKAISRLCELGRISVADGMIMDDRAAEEIAKRERALKLQCLGGEKSAEKRKQNQHQKATDPQLSLNYTDRDIEEEKREANASPKKKASRLPDDAFLPASWDQKEAIASSRPATAENPAVAALAAWASPAAVASFIAYRRKAKGGFTLTAAKRLAENLKAIFNGGGDPDDALGMAEERGWQTIKPEWYFREKSSGDGNRNRQAESSGDRQLRLIAVAARSL